MPVTYPDRPAVGVSALVLDEDRSRVLLVRRGARPGRLMWSIPGGHVEPGETLFQAVARELEEETGLSGRPLGVVSVDEAIRVDDLGVKYHYIIIVILVDPNPGVPRPGGDVIEAAYYRIDEALQLDLVPSIRGLLERLAHGELPLDRPLKPRLFTPPD